MTTALYVPGTSEKDMTKVIMSAQLVAGQTATNTDSITTANTNIATNTTAIAAINASRASASTFGLAEVDGTTVIASSGVISASLPKITASLGSDTAISNSVYSDGPSVAQGTSGTWFASGTVTVTDTAGVALITAKLWDGTTVVASTQSRITIANGTLSISLSGVLASPAANIKISCTSNAAGATSTFKFNSSGNSKDSTLTAVRIA